VAPDTVKLEPATTAELTFTGTLPVEVSVRAFVSAVFTTTFPKATLVAFMLSAGTAAFN
jgi:hypothetical protein